MHWSPSHHDRGGVQCAYHFSADPHTHPHSSANPYAHPQPARIWISPATPKTLQGGIKIEVGMRLWIQRANADLAVEPAGETRGESSWIFSLVVPFNISGGWDRLGGGQAHLAGRPGADLPGAPILLSPDTLAAFESLWGTAAPDRVKVVDPDEITDALWQGQGFGLIPFEQVNPRLKVLNVDGRISAADRI